MGAGFSMSSPDLGGMVGGGTSYSISYAVNPTNTNWFGISATVSLDSGVTTATPLIVFPVATGVSKVTCAPITNGYTPPRPSFAASIKCDFPLSSAVPGTAMIQMTYFLGAYLFSITTPSTSTIVSSTTTTTTPTTVVPSTTSTTTSYETTTVVTSYTPTTLTGVLSTEYSGCTTSTSSTSTSETSSLTSTSKSASTTTSSKSSKTSSEATSTKPTPSLSSTTTSTTSESSKLTSSTTTTKTTTATSTPEPTVTITTTRYHTICPCDSLSTTTPSYEAHQNYPRGISQVPNYGFFDQTLSAGQNAISTTSTTTTVTETASTTVTVASGSTSTTEIIPTSTSTTFIQQGTVDQRTVTTVSGCRPDQPTVYIT